MLLGMQGFDIAQILLKFRQNILSNFPKFWVNLSKFYLIYPNLLKFFPNLLKFCQNLPKKVAKRCGQIPCIL